MPTKTEPLSAKEAANKLGTDARTLRKFLRKRSGVIGQGNRWAIEPKELKKLRKEFEKWQAEGAKPKATTDEAPSKSKAKNKKPNTNTDSELIDTVDDDDAIADLSEALFELGDDDDLESYDD